MGGDDQVAYGGEHHPGGDAFGLHGNDRRFGEGIDAQALVEVHLAFVAELALGGSPTSLTVQVGTGADELLEIVAG